MKSAWLTAVLLSTVCIASVACECDKIDLSHWYGPQKPYPYEQAGLQNEPLPESFNWANNGGKNYLTRIKHQKLPINCGSCWAMSAVNTISDRISVMRKAAFPEINLSTQVLLTCDLSNNGCNGGSHVTILEFIKNNPITDESCAPYLAKDFKQGLQCDEMAYCKDCNKKGECWVPKKYNKYTIEDYGNIRSGDVEGMMREIYHNGPLICSVNQRALNGFSCDRVLAKNDTGETTHAVEVVGWGSDNGTPYWIMKNTFGEEWCERGYMRVYRGNNTARIEEACTWVTPKDTWSNQTLPHSSLQSGERQAHSRPAENTGPDAPRDLGSAPLEYSCELGEDNPADSLVLTDVYSSIRQQDIPDSYFLGDVNGINFLTPVVNENLPQYCGSCWAQAVASAVADRINFLVTKNTPKVTLSVQPLLNCRAGGSCRGGSKSKALKWLAGSRLSESGCQPYQAYDPQDPSCYPIQQCMFCSWVGDHVTTCFDIPYKGWSLSEYGPVPKAHLQKEVFVRGPVVCSMTATQKFREYSGGVFEEPLQAQAFNHVVSIVGFGKEQSGEGYWIVRNSWGTQFGENGFFRIRMGRDNLGIEENCWFGVPTERR